MEGGEEVSLCMVSIWIVAECDDGYFCGGKGGDRIADRKMRFDMRG